MNNATTKIMFITLMFGSSMFAYGQDSSWGGQNRISAALWNKVQGHHDGDKADIVAEFQVKNLRGNRHIDFKIDADVQMKDLLNRLIEDDHYRRRLGPIPKSKAILVPCHNATSDCGIHGVCRISGTNKFCDCDAGYSSLTKENPCAEKGKVQLMLAFVQYLFGYTGGPAFALGWTALGVSTLLLFCCGLCCTSCAKESDRSDGASMIMWVFGALCGLAAFGLWIYTCVKVSTDCVDKHGVPCKSW